MKEQREQNEQLHKEISQLKSHVDQLKVSLSGKERDIEALDRDKVIMKEKMTEQEVRYEKLRRKMEAIQQEKAKV